ncbi:MAG: hypothetical protein M3478_14050 [Planctomycetota bacterium]|nr:hypothetical protein [Planctomycetota bacterium]
MTGGDIDAVCILDDADRLTPSIEWTTSGASRPEFGRTEGAFLQIGSKLYTLGGYLSEEGMPVTNRVQVLDFATNEWWTSVHFRPVPRGRTAQSRRMAGSFTSSRGQTGGGYGARTTKSFKHEIATDTWSSFRALSEVRYGGTMFYADGRLHFVGGAGADRETPGDDHWVIDPSARATRAGSARAPCR